MLFEVILSDGAAANSLGVGRLHQAAENLFVLAAIEVLDLLAYVLAD